MTDKVILELKSGVDENTVENAERLLRSFYRTIEPYRKRDWRNPRRIAWEVYAEKDSIRFFVVCDRKIERLIRSRIQEAYPNAGITKIEEDYVEAFQSPFVAEMELHRHYMFPTKITKDDIPLHSVLKSMSELQEGERMLLQIVMLPINNRWQGKVYEQYRRMLFGGIRPKKKRKFNWKSGVFFSVDLFFRALESVISTFIPLSAEKTPNTPIEREELKATQKKMSAPGFLVNIRMAVESKNKNNMNTRLSELAGSFIELDAENEWRRVKADQERTMRFIRERKAGGCPNNIVTTLELAPLVRLPNKHIQIQELTSAIKTPPIPQGLDKGLFFAYALHHDEEKPVYIDDSKKEDFVHPMIYTGGMGGGKTTAIMNSALARALAGYSVILIDTQGDMTKDFLSQIPESELDRVVWLDFSDFRYPVALDLMEFVSLSQQNQKIDEVFIKDIAKNELISIFKKMWGSNFGPQTEYITRNNITAIIETGGTFMDMFRMLIDDAYRDEITMRIRDKAPFAYSFWLNFQQNFNHNQKMRMVMPSINKIGTFVESPIIRNIISQGQQKYNFREMMDEGKIVMITIPKGVLAGAWKLIAGLVISKIWLAALTRADIPIEQRKPCFLYSDEADDIINDNFPIMLSQSRKFRLGIHLGFQYLDQIKNNNKAVYQAIIGNRPSMMAMKIGEKDLEMYAEIFKGYYTKEELRNFPNLHGVAQLSINGQPTTPFTIRIPANFHTKDDTWRRIDEEKIERIRKDSRQKYARPLEEVERITKERYEELLSAIQLSDDGMDDDVELSEEMIAELRNIR